MPINLKLDINYCHADTVNQSGNECPYALKMLACLVLQEITTFMRERFQNLPRTKKQKMESGWEKQLSTRRYSSIVSSPGHSDKSSESNIGEMPHSPGKFDSQSCGQRTFECSKGNMFKNASNV